MTTISKQTRIAFREHLVGWTLRTISDLFDAAEIPRADVSHLSLPTGARRSLVEEYYAGVDWSSPRDIKKVLRAYEQILNGLENPVGMSLDYAERERKKLVGLLQRDGFVYENGRLVPAGGVDLKSLTDASEAIDRTTLHDHIQRIEQSIESDPPQAIGSSKELVETVAKHVLIQYGEDPEKYDTLQQLVKAALKSLDLSLENIPETKKGVESIRQVLAGLAQIVGGTAELRNLYGTGHGRARSGGLESLHARLVVGAAATLSRFVLETLDERKRKKGS